VLVTVGDRCADGVDGDLDGRIDTDDADCDGPEDGLIVGVGAGRPLRVGLAPADAFTVTRDAAGAVATVTGSATVDARGTTVAVDATRGPDGHWQGQVELGDDALGPHPLHVAAARAHLREVAPDVIHGEVRARGQTYAFLLLDGT
jgi:hypothetical protein